MKLRTGVVSWLVAALICSPAAAVPVSAKMPVPMIAPMPSAVRSSAESVRFIWRSGASDSRIKSSGLFVLKSCDATFLLRLRLRERIVALPRDEGQCPSFLGPSSVAVALWATLGAGLPSGRWDETSLHNNGTRACRLQCASHSEAATGEGRLPFERPTVKPLPYGSPMASCETGSRRAEKRPTRRQA